MKVTRLNKCGKCEVSFASKVSLKTHIQTVHEGKKSIHQCKMLNSTFNCFSDMKNHVMSVHENTKKKTMHLLNMQI